MNEVSNHNQSSKSAEITRITSRKKQAKITVGLTIEPALLAQARNRNLNLSKIFEQALSINHRILSSTKRIRKL